jgi:hypothetical protein
MFCCSSKSKDKVKENFQRPACIQSSAFFVVGDRLSPKVQVGDERRDGFVK